MLNAEAATRVHTYIYIYRNTTINIPVWKNGTQTKLSHLYCNCKAYTHSLALLTTQRCCSFHKPTHTEVHTHRLPAKMVSWRTCFLALLALCSEQPGRIWCVLLERSNLAFAIFYLGMSSRPLSTYFAIAFRAPGFQYAYVSFLELCTLCTRVQHL